MGIHSGSPSLTIQEDVFQRLTADTALQSFVSSRIYDSLAASRAQAPYLVLNGWLETPQDLLTRKGRRTTFAVNIWSAYAGMKEAKLIASIVIDSLDRYTMATSEWESWQITFESLNTLEDLENMKRIVLRFKVESGKI